MIIPTESGIFIDMKHFFASAGVTFSGQGIGKAGTFVLSQALGFGVEIGQSLSESVRRRSSAFSQEDLVSNFLGAVFALTYNPNENLAGQVDAFLSMLGGIENLDEYKKTKEFQGIPKDVKAVVEKQIQKEEQRAQIFNLISLLLKGGTNPDINITISSEQEN